MKVNVSPHSWGLIIIIQKQLMELINFNGMVTGRIRLRASCYNWSNVADFSGSRKMVCWHIAELVIVLYMHDLDNFMLGSL